MTPANALTIVKEHVEENEKASSDEDGQDTDGMGRDSIQWNTDGTARVEKNG